MCENIEIENYLMDNLNSYIGNSGGVLLKKFGINSKISKSTWIDLTYNMLGVISNQSNILKDNSYEKLEDEELLTIYRSILEEDVSDNKEKYSENGVKSYIMEMELEKRGIEFRSIIDDVLSKL